MHRWIEDGTGGARQPVSADALQHCVRDWQMDWTHLVAVRGFAWAVIAAILVTKSEQALWYAGLHGGGLLLRRRGRVLSRGRIDQKPDGSRLSCNEQLVHFFANAAEYQVSK